MKKQNKNNATATTQEDNTKVTPGSQTVGDHRIARLKNKVYFEGECELLVDRDPMTLDELLRFRYWATKWAFEPKEDEVRVFPEEHTCCFVTFPVRICYLTTQEKADQLSDGQVVEMFAKALEKLGEELVSEHDLSYSGKKIKKIRGTINKIMRLPAYPHAFRSLRTPAKGDYPPGFTPGR